MDSIHLHTISNEFLLELLQEFSVLEGEIPCLIRLLLDVRSFQRRLGESEDEDRRKHLKELGRGIENKISQEIILALTAQVA
jgi:hypothetical protein